LEQEIDAILKRYGEMVATDSSPLAKHRGVIDEGFGSKETVEDIISSLEKLSQDGDGAVSEWGKHNLKIIKRVSPTSLKVILILHS